jgi:phage FluMu protein Com
MDNFQIKHRDRRCSRCGRLLGRFLLAPGSYLEIRCPRCSAMNVAHVTPNSTAIMDMAAILAGLNGSAPDGLLELLSGLFDTGEKV